MSIATLARPEIQALQAYEAAEQVDDTVRLNANESPIVSAVDHFRRPLNRYPEVRPQKLQHALAARFYCSPDQLLVTRGSSEAIDLLVRTFCRAGEDSVVTTSPSFSMYRHYAEIQGAKFIAVATQASENFAIDIDAVLATCDESTRLIFICSPNNPTGTTLPRDELEKLLQRRGDKSAVVVDEAYVEFADVPSVVELLDEYPNLLVLRTLSKALGFAGARCGAVIGPPAVIQLLSAVQAPYALATPVVECVEDALQDEQLALAERAVARIIEERKRLMREISAFDFVKKIWPSDANFFLIEVDDAAKVLQRCQEHQVLLRHFGGDLANCIRITVGSVDDNNQLLEALETLRGSKPCL
ncbi:MAG: histidinol-phosphate transaminase [Gammaproteobacteria bacterium]|nr:histidinol-phosphate transaminase [Gammaproteobacteria bacterium]